MVGTKTLSKIEATKVFIRFASTLWKKLSIEFVLDAREDRAQRVIQKREVHLLVAAVADLRCVASHVRRYSQHRSDFSTLERSGLKELRILWTQPDLRVLPFTRQNSRSPLVAATLGRFP